jgi:hypothetical protein
MSTKEDQIKWAAIRQDYIEKVAASSFPVPFGQNGVRTVLGVAGLIGAAVLVSTYTKKLIEAIDKLGYAAMEESYFKKMIRENPKLMEEDPEEVAKLWGTLYKNAPRLAQDPVAAGAFIKQNIDMQVVPQFGGPSLDTYKSLLDINNKLEPDSSMHSNAMDVAAGLF